VLDGVREVLDRARRERLFRGILRRRVRLGQVGQDHLRVALGAERARLQQRLAVVNAAAIDILACIDVVQGVGDTVQALEERVIEEFFFFPHPL